MADKLIDFISGKEVNATPEEIDAVQVFSRSLVNDYKYPKELIQTHPQFRVKVRPSDVNKEYPVDIAVFTNSKKDDDSLYIIVECKKKNREDGKTQLQDYMRLSKAYLGVWFNGEERLFLHKIEKDGKVIFEDIPNIPQYKQRLEDIGQYKRKNLVKAHNLKSTFKAIRNYLAANTVGATRDEVLAQQLINLVFCKIYDEKFTKPEDMVSFRCGVNEKKKEIAERIQKIFLNVKKVYKDVIDADDKITLDNESIAYVVGELQNYCLMDAERDVVADAFEVFIDHALKGGQGQFFTPRNVIKMIIELVNPQNTDLIIDPACGSGGFLVESLRYIWKTLDEQALEYGWDDLVLQTEKTDVAFNCIRGIDKDYFLAKVCKAYMAIIGDGKSGIFCEDSLEKPEKWSDLARQRIDLNKFDIVLTNPPFGKNITVKGLEKLKQYDLAYKYKKDKKTNQYIKGKIKDQEAPQILFIERCLQFLNEKGKMAIVLPDGCFGNESLSYLRAWLLEHVKIIGVIDLPLETFLPNTGTKTSVLLCKKAPIEEINKDYPVFMCIAETCGHDRRGKEIESDDIKEIPLLFKKWCDDNNIEF